MASITTRNGQRCTAVPKVANILLASNSSSTSTSTSTSSSSTSTSTSTSTSSTLVSSISTTSSSSLASSSSTSISIPSDPQATPVDNPAQPVSATQISLDTSSSTISTAAGAGLIPTFAAPAISSSADQSSADQPADQATSTLPASIINTTNGASLSSGTEILTDTGPTPSPPTDEAQSSDALATDGATSAQSLTGQSGDSNLTSGLDGNTATLTAAGTQSAGSSSLETETNGGGLSTTQQQVTGNAITTQQTIAIAAGVVGGVIIISSIAFMIWIWRKRKMQGRRSTLLTPLSPDATFRDREKDPYLIDRSSLGPTPMSEKLWAIVGMKYKRLRGRVNDIVARSSSPSPSVNLDRGNSQFGPPDGVHSRSNSNAGVIGGPPTTKGRFVDWWGRLAEDGNFNWRLRRESKADPINNDSFAVPRPTDNNNNNNNAPRIPSQPDFLTLLNMDDRQLEQAARGRNSVRGSQRRSISVGNEQHFLGGLGLNFDDPFSDVNAIGNNTAKAKPTVVSAANNPFSDANAIAAPSAAANGGLTTYVQNVRRSRGHSVNGGGISRQTSNAGTRMNSVMNSLYRESNASISTIGTRRNKFRSDPFDLDRPDLLSANSSFDATVREPNRSSKGIPNTPKRVHVRTESFTSKYSSGVSGVSMSMSQWSDPGPDVGPAAARYTPDNGIARRDSDTRRSGGSQGSVGKAL